MSFAVVHPGARSRARSFAQGAEIPDVSAPPHEGFFAHTDLLRIISFHRIVQKFDTDARGAGNASSVLLCRITCGGGDCVVEHIAFLGSSSPASREELLESARLLLTNEKSWQEEVESSQHRAAEFFSFRKTAARLQSFPA